ncbi:Uncharacterised protein [Legionella pneumophila]|nr:Uncharacterised protein [Legionella pneumophila]CZL11279.1 Uncharacterised protein [Legionella pneumophila]
MIDQELKKKLLTQLANMSTNVTRCKVKLIRSEV